MTTASYDEYLDFTLPFLRAVHEQRDSRDGAGMRAIGLLGDGPAAGRRWSAITAAGYADGSVFDSADGTIHQAVGIYLRPEGLRAIGEWPRSGNELELLLQLVERELAEATTDEERSKWSAIRDALLVAMRQPGANQAFEALLRLVLPHAV